MQWQKSNRNRGDLGSGELTRETLNNLRAKHGNRNEIGINTITVGEKRMDHCELADELSAYRELLQSGKLTEIDLDALGICLSETLTLLEDLRADSDDALILKENIRREITNMSLAVVALKVGRCDVNQSKLLDELSNLSAEQLLRARSRAKELLSDLQRSGRMPLKTFGKQQDNQTIEDYRIGVERVA